MICKIFSNSHLGIWNGPLKIFPFKSVEIEPSRLRYPYHSPYFSSLKCLKVSKADAIAVGRAAMGDLSLLYRI